MYMCFYCYNYISTEGRKETDNHNISNNYFDLPTPTITVSNVYSFACKNNDLFYNACVNYNYIHVLASYNIIMCSDEKIHKPWRAYNYTYRYWYSR